MNSEVEVDMDPSVPEVDSSQSIPFQLQFVKPIPSQVKIAEWNPEKDLLATVTEDSKILLYRFNWQRLWTVSPGRCVNSLCWRPDGKAITVGLEDGSIVLYHVENGKLLKSIRHHNTAVVSLNWEEAIQNTEDDGNLLLTYEDRTIRFFPLPPRVPRMPGLASGDIGLADDVDDSLCDLSIPSHRQLSILCSMDKCGNICFSIFGMFPIGRINIHELPICSFCDRGITYHLGNASVLKLALSKNLCQLVILTFGELVEGSVVSSVSSLTVDKAKSTFIDQPLHKDESLAGLHCLILDTSVFSKRKKELHQVALQASSIEHLIEVSRASLSVMHKQWSDAMRTFQEKFDPLSSLIADHGLDSNLEEEFLSFLFGARTSPPLHQFLVNTLGELGLKRVSKTINGAGEELHLVIREHLQPSAEMICFRIGELRGFSRWRVRYQGIGLDEKLLDDTMEKAGMFLVHVERFLRVLAIVLHLFQNFFNWLTKCIKLLMSEPTDQVPPHNSEHVILFLKFHVNKDLVRQLLESSDENIVDVDLETANRVEELVKFGGFSDVNFLGRTLARQFDELEHSLKEALSLPLSATSKRITCDGLLPLFPHVSSSQISSSISFYEGHTGHKLVDYACFQMPEGTFGLSNSIVITKGIMNCACFNKICASPLEAVALCIPQGYHCVDLSLYKDSQIVLLLNEDNASSENVRKSWLMMVSTTDLPFNLLSLSSHVNDWILNDLKESATELNFENGRMRSIPHTVTMPLAVSASRGVACVFALRKRALVYILDEDEDEDEGSDAE